MAQSAANTQEVTLDVTTAPETKILNSEAPCGALQPTMRKQPKKRGMYGHSLSHTLLMNDVVSCDGVPHVG